MVDPTKKEKPGRGRPKGVHKVSAADHLAKMHATNAALKAAAKAGGGMKCDSWNTIRQRGFCRKLKAANLFFPFASVNDDFKMECKEDEGYADAVVASMGMASGRSEAEGHVNWVRRVDHAQKVRSANPVDGGEAGARVNAKTEELLALYKIDDVIATHPEIFKGVMFKEPRSIYIGQVLAAVHTEMVCDASYSWRRAMDAARCFYGKRKNIFLTLGRPSTTEERVKLVDRKHNCDVQKIMDVFQPAWDEDLPLPAGRLVIYSNRGDDRYSVWKEYRFEASSPAGFYSDLGQVDSSYTPGKLPAVLKAHYREEVASVPGFKQATSSDAQLVYNWCAAARGRGTNRPRAMWGKAWEIYFDDDVEIGRLDD